MPTPADPASDRVDLAALYVVETKGLNQAVKRNIERFPEDFMFRLTAVEAARLRSQAVTIKIGRGQHRKHMPYAFTEHGIAMLFSVLRSERAVRVNIAIMRAFVRLRDTLGPHKELATRLADLERKIESHDEGIRTLFEAIHQLMASPEMGWRSIGFRVQEGQPTYGTLRRVRRGAGTR
jgi:hypothetical protein